MKNQSMTDSNRQLADELRVSDAKQSEVARFVMQHVKTNYDTDLIRPIVEFAAGLSVRPA